MKRSMMLITMAVSVAHAASDGVSIVDVCNVPVQLKSLYGKITTISNGVSVVLNVPETIVMFHDLKMPITITVSNGTENAVPFIRDVSFAYERQIWIDLGDREQFNHPPKFGLKDKKRWDTTFDMNTMPVDWRLNPSASASWKLHSIEHIRDIVDYASERGTSNITARIRLGDSQWVSSETHTFRVVPRSLEYVTDTDYWAQYKVAEFEYVVTKRDGFDRERKETKKAPFFAIPIKGKRTLLDYKSNEICELQGEELPEFKFDKEAETVSIALPNRKQIRYNLTKGKVEPDDNPK